MLRLKKTTTTGKGNLVILISKASGAAKWLTTAEMRYVKKRISEKAGLVHINRLNRHIFIQLIPVKKIFTDVLEDMRKDACRLLGTINELRIKSFTIVDQDGKKEETLAYAEGMLLGSYRFDHYLKDKKNKNLWLTEVLVHSRLTGQADLEELNYLAMAVFKARTLINEPVNQLNAQQLAVHFKKMGNEGGFTVTVFDRRKIETLRMGGLLAVNKGSIDEPCFTIMEWKPAGARNKKPVVIIGKGITFDTGGLSLKPTPDSMDYMKSDMSGAAATGCLMYLIARMKLQLHVIGIVPSTDNRPDGNAMAPGDIIRMYDGTTVEVLNTDAEGRLILADALAYAKKFNPSLVITIATLTGAAAAALGKMAMAGMGNANKKTMDKLVESGYKVHERVALLPFWDDYKEMLKSDIADLQNIGGKYAGTITAGKFLEHFTNYPFIHLDIAGMAFSKENDSYRGKGATGTGIRLLYDFLKTIN